MRRPPKRKDGKQGLYDGIYDHLGRPTCDGETAMEYVLTDSKSGKHLYRCPEGGCKLKPRSSGVMRYCVQTENHWEDPLDNIKVMARSPALPTNGKRDTAVGRPSSGCSAVSSEVGFWTGICTSPPRKSTLTSPCRSYRMPPLWSPASSPGRSRKFDI